MAGPFLVEKNIYDLMIGQVGVEEVLQKEAIENLDIIPTSIDLSAAEIELIGVDAVSYTHLTLPTNGTV